MERDQFRCTFCNHDEITLNVHHKKYAKSGNPWDVELTDLTTLCEICHKGTEENKQRMLECLSRCEYFIETNTHGDDIYTLLMQLFHHPEYIGLFSRIIHQASMDGAEAQSIGYHAGKRDGLAANG